MAQGQHVRSAELSAAAIPTRVADQQMFRSTYDRLVEEHVIEKPFDFHEAYTTRFLEEIYRRPLQPSSTL